MSQPTPNMGVKSVHQSRPVGAVPPKATPAQIRQQSAQKTPAKHPTKRGK